jgi:4-amino-4-deoxy-L-arabinose transferase-like glycosyltransferase
MYLIVGSAFAILTPAWQNPDEPAHYNYVRQLVVARRLPVIEAQDWTAGLVPIAPNVRDIPTAQMTYQDHQPPLFYLLSMPVFALWKGDLIALRLFALSVGALVVLCAYAVVNVVFPTRPALAALSASFVALLPQHLAIMASYNNDALAEALLNLTLLLAARLVVGRDALIPRQAVRLGFVAGLSLLTKAQAYLALPVALLGTWLASRTQPIQDRRSTLGLLAIIATVAALLGLPWWARNIALYGGLDFLGLQRHNEVVIGQPTTAEWLAERGLIEWLSRMVQTTFQSFWGQFGWMTIPLAPRIYLVLLAFTLLSAALFLAWWLRSSRGKRQNASLTLAQSRALTLMAALALLTLLAFVWYNAQFVQHQGRYLFPALVPIATALALGWDFALARWPLLARWLWAALLVGLAAFDLYLLFRVILPEMSR